MPRRPASPAGTSRPFLVTVLAVLATTAPRGAAQQAFSAAVPSNGEADSADRPQVSQQLQRVEINGSNNDLAARRALTTTKIIVGRDEIERFCDQTIGEVLKRLPGVTESGRPGRGGEIALRGLGGGYTQILISGEPIPAGLSLESISPDQVEWVETLRAPSAEYGTRVVASTINIVLRESSEKSQSQLRVGFSAARTHPARACLDQERSIWRQRHSDSETRAGYRGQIRLRTLCRDPWPPECQYLLPSHHEPDSHQDKIAHRDLGGRAAVGCPAGEPARRVDVRPRARGEVPAQRVAGHAAGRFDTVQPKLFQLQVCDVAGPENRMQQPWAGEITSSGRRDETLCRVNRQWQFRLDIEL